MSWMFYGLDIDFVIFKSFNISVLNFEIDLEFIWN